MSDLSSAAAAAPRPRRPRGFTIVAACAALGFVVLASLAHRVAYFPIDLTLTRSVQSIHAPWLEAPLMVLNGLGFPPLVGIIYGSIILVLFVARRRWEAVAAAFAVLGGAILNHLAKLIVARPRPDPGLITVEHHIHNGTFPAGHVLNFTAFAGFLCYLVAVRSSPSWHRTALITVLVLLIALMGLARIHSGEHWPTDVLGGYLLGGAWLAVTLAFYRWGKRRARDGSDAGSMRSVLVAMLLTTAVPCWGIVEAHADDQGTAPVAAIADTSDLGPTSAPPWNPSRAMSARQAWEQVVLVPGRVVSLPFVGLGHVTQAAMAHVEGTSLFPIVPQTARARSPRLLAFQLPGLGDGAGTGGAVELRSPFGPRLPQLSARYAATLLNYNSTWAGASLGPITLQYGYDWRSQDKFYGVGTSTSKDSLADFAAQDEFARGTFHWGSSPDSASAHPRLSIRAWGGPRSLVTRTGRATGEVSYDARFPALGAATLDRRVEHLVYGGSLSTDWRAGRPHWSHGGRLSLGFERYDMPIQALALRSARFDGAQFTRYSAETEGALSFMRDPRTIRLLVRLTDQSVGAGRDHFLISDMARLGGRDGLPGFGPGRFHDLDMLYGRLMYVFPLARLFEFEVHSEWGAVYHDVWTDAKLGTLQHSVGLSLRFRNDVAPRGSLGFDASSEGVRIHYALGGVE